MIFVDCGSFMCSGLMVGHTHEDIDQIFSVISKAMLGRSKKSGPYVELKTPGEFDTFLQTEVFQAPAVVTRVRKLYDFDSLIDGSVNPHLRGLGHSQWALEGIKNPVHCIRMIWDRTGADSKGQLFHVLSNFRVPFEPHNFLSFQS